jgi:N-methylhydantoinase A/oxoprolinase/acetone carboxylase beta subunit
VLVPDSAGVLSALGLAAADERRDAVRSYVCPLEEAGELPPEGDADLRYRGQSFELTVPLQAGLADAFHRAHEARYGYADRERLIELVAVRTAEVRPAQPLELPIAEPLEATGPRVIELAGATCWLPQGWVGVRDGTSSTLRLTRVSRDSAESVK